jgi:hypothetical protein
MNYFQPSMKLLNKSGLRGARPNTMTTQTLYQRALGANTIKEEQKIRLRETYQSLDPLKLLNELTGAFEDQFWAYAYKKPDSSAVPAAAKVPRAKCYFQ